MVLSDELPTSAQLLAKAKATHSVNMLLKHHDCLADGSYDAVISDESTWQGVRSDLLKASNDCQATTEAQVASCAKKLTKAKTNIFNKFMASARGLTTVAAADKDVVVGVMSTIFFRFVEEFQSSLVYRHVQDLPEQVSRHYNDDRPAIKEDQRQYEALYYIAGYVLQAARKNGNRRSEGKHKSEVGAALTILAENAAYGGSVDAADELHNSGLPFGRTLRTEQFDNLCYPKREFFDLMVRIENVMSQCLTGENFCAFGSLLLRKICVALVNTDDVTITISSLLPEATETNVIRQVVIFIMRIYGRLRGKDALRKMNSILKKKKSTSQSTRSTLAVESKKRKDATVSSKNKKSKTMSSTGEYATAAVLEGTGGAGGDTGSVPAADGSSNSPGNTDTAAHAGTTDASTTGTPLVGNTTKDNTEGNDDDVNALLKEIEEEDEEDEEYGTKIGSTTQA